MPKKKVVLSSIMLADRSTEPDALSRTPPGEEPAGAQFRKGLRFYRRGDAFTYFLVVYPAWKAGLESKLQIKTEFLLDGEPIAPAPYRPLTARLLGQNEKGTIVGGRDRTLRRATGHLRAAGLGQRSRRRPHGPALNDFRDRLVRRELSELH